MVAFYSSSLLWRVVFLLVQGTSASKSSALGEDICEEKQKHLHRRLISQPRQEKQDKWTLGEKVIA